jgi:hypothetical protein
VIPHVSEHDEADAPHYERADRLPWKTSRRTLLLGATVGTLVGGLQALQARLAPLREEIRQGLQDESPQTPSGENAAGDDRPS